MTMGQSRRDMLKLGSLAFLGAEIQGGVLAGRERQAGPLAGAAFAPAYRSGAYQLPPLPYDYDALEPLYDEKTLRIHHDKHHAGYVNGLNRTLEKLQKAREDNDYTSIEALSRDLAFHGSGHVLHALFWNSMSPTRAEMPSGLARALEMSFGSTENARNQFAAATKAVMGSGWGVLVYEPIADRLLILQASKHQDLTIWNTVPLLVCDVWEHAYYLQYQNNRGAWVDNFMKMANWSFAAGRLEQVRSTAGRQ